MKYLIIFMSIIISAPIQASAAATGDNVVAATMNRIRPLRFVKIYKEDGTVVGFLIGGKPATLANLTQTTTPAQSHYNVTSRSPTPQPAEK